MFLNPLMLFALAGIAAPILIHLLNNRQVQKVKWAAMRFIQTAVQQNRRRMNLEDLLLLLLRCLIVGLLALAMARPAIRSPITSVLGQSKVAAALVLDNSESMALTDGTISRFDLSKKIAGEIVDGLPHGSTATLALASDVSTPLIAEPTADLRFCRQAIESAQRSDRSTDLLPSLSQALTALAGQPSARKELWIITDGQALGLRQIQQIETLLRNNQKTIHATFVIDGLPEAHNLAVTDIKLSEGQFASTNMPLSVDIQVRNFGTSAVDNIPVSLHVDHDQPSAQGHIDAIPPGESKSVTLSITFHDEGFHSVTAQLPHDRMLADDQRSLAVRVVKQLQVLLVTSDPDPTSRQGSLFFLRHALTPVPASKLDSYFLRTRTVTPAELDSTRLDEIDMVVLANTSSVSPAAIDALKNYENAGGGLLVFPGPQTDASFYNDKLSGDLLPATLGKPRGDAEDQAHFMTLQSGDYVHPIVSFWSDPGAGSLATARFFRTFPLVPLASSKSSPVSTILSFSDGSPAVMSRRNGLGETILFASSADTAWNDFPLRAAYLPLMLRTVAHLLQRRDQPLNLRVGDAFSIPVPADCIGKSAIVIRPSIEEASTTDKDKTSKDLRQVELHEGTPVVTYAQTDLGGVYDVNIEGDKPLKLKFAACPDASESDLALAGDSQWQRLSQVARVIPYRPDMQLGAEIATDRVGKELWMALGFTVLLFAAMEMLMADWFSQSK